MRKNFRFLGAVLAVSSVTASMAQTITSSVIRWGLDPVRVTYGSCSGTGQVPSTTASLNILDEASTTVGNDPYAGTCVNGTIVAGAGYVARMLWPGSHTLKAQTCFILPQPGPFCCQSTCNSGAPAPVAVITAGTPIPELGASVTVATVYNNNNYDVSSPPRCPGTASFVAPSSTAFAPPPGMASPQYIGVTTTCGGAVSVGVELPFTPGNGDLWVYDNYPIGGANAWRSVTTSDPEVGFNGFMAILKMRTPGWIAFSHPGVAPTPITTPGITPRTGMWWGGPSQSGWGMQVSTHASSAGDRLFVAAYIYDAGGNPLWVVMPSGAWDSTHTTWTGDLYAPRSAPFSSYDATHYAAGNSLGTGQLKFSSDGSAAFSYPTGGDRAIQFYQFAADGSPGTYQGLWWGGPAQNGWGLSIAQQGGTVFATWFTYDASGNPVWFYMPGATRLGEGHYQGTLYRTSGGPWPSQVPYVGSMTKVSPAGTLDLQFSNGDAGVMNAVVDGKAVSIPIGRFDF